MTILNAITFLLSMVIASLVMLVPASLVALPALLVGEGFYHVVSVCIALLFGGFAAHVMAEQH
jgi:hypothetical protein